MCRIFMELIRVQFTPRLGLTSHARVVIKWALLIMAIQYQRSANAQSVKVAS